ncbi:MAG: cytochrome c [Gammaproteobacteria bacterium]|nr:cytochrome c [Gammaproteobacteria bacterium]NIR83505.1 cytochrome c [Gammaproteobacteria bacterium]NIR91427.1 cytochrome c [Gammaproteobacteria bacterium]NIU04667.1 cytochrome c [Gammaproteobacteria bacterium]NIV51709.1 c-type cytochrome [Gammaproteobacteria bacterium]
MRGLAAIAISLFMLAAAGAAQAAGDAAAGKKKAAMCAACHGMDGLSTQPIYPKLAGQNEVYLVSALKAYKSGARDNPIMKPMVAPLSGQDMENLAAYFSSLECK